MTLLISTSTPRVYVAQYDAGGARVEVRSADGKRQSGALLAQYYDELVTGSLDRIVVDGGPGGFTSTRVGLTFGKTLAYAHGAELAVCSVFDLVSSGDVAIPARAGQWFLRLAGQMPETIGALPDGVIEFNPRVSLLNLPESLADLPVEAADPLSAVPNYIAEPSISIAKDQRGMTC